MSRNRIPGCLSLTAGSHPPRRRTRGGSGDEQARRGQHLASPLAAGRRHRPARLRDRRRSLHGAGLTRRTLHHRKRPADDVLRRLGERDEEIKPDVDGDDDHPNDDSQQDRTDDNDDQNHDDRDTDDQNHDAVWHAEHHHAYHYHHARAVTSPAAAGTLG